MDVGRVNLVQRGHQHHGLFGGMEEGLAEEMGDLGALEPKQYRTLRGRRVRGGVACRRACPSSRVRSGHYFGVKDLSSWMVLVFPTFWLML